MEVGRKRREQVTRRGEGKRKWIDGKKERERGVRGRAIERRGR